jgi:hypothetical protein
MLPFLILQYPLIQMKTMLTRLVYVHDAVEADSQEDDAAFVRETTASTDVTAM